MDISRASPSVLTEIDKVQNPAFGAYLLWRYGRTYQDQLTASPSHLLLYFLVLPICLHRPTLNFVVSTHANSGLGKFCEKLGKDQEELLAIHERCLKLRKLTLSSVAFGVRAGLFSVNYEAGNLRANDAKHPNLAERIKPNAKGADKLGIWFRNLEAIQIFKALRVEP